MERLKVWYQRQLGEGTFNIRYLILWFMLAIFPLLVIPNHIWIRFALGTVPPGISLSPQVRRPGHCGGCCPSHPVEGQDADPSPGLHPPVFFHDLAAIAGFLAPIQITAWVGSPYRFTGLTTYYFCICFLSWPRLRTKPKDCSRPWSTRRPSSPAWASCSISASTLSRRTEHLARGTATGPCPTRTFSGRTPPLSCRRQYSCSPIEKNLSPVLPGPGLCRPDRQSLQGYLDRLADRPGGHRLVCVEQARE